MPSSFNENTILRKIFSLAEIDGNPGFSEVFKAYEIIKNSYNLTKYQDGRIYMKILTLTATGKFRQWKSRVNTRSTIKSNDHKTKRKEKKDSPMEDNYNSNFDQSYRTDLPGLNLSDLNLNDIYSDQVETTTNTNNKQELFYTTNSTITTTTVGENEAVPFLSFTKGISTIQNNASNNLNSSINHHQTAPPLSSSSSSSSSSSFLPNYTSSTLIPIPPPKEALDLLNKILLPSTTSTFIDLHPRDTEPESELTSDTIPTSKVEKTAPESINATNVLSPSKMKMSPSVPVKFNNDIQLNRSHIGKEDPTAGRISISGSVKILGIFKNWIEQSKNGCFLLHANSCCHVTEENLPGSIHDDWLHVQMRKTVLFQVKLKILKSWNSLVLKNKLVRDFWTLKRLRKYFLYLLENAQYKNKKPKSLCN